MTRQEAIEKIAKVWPDAARILSTVKIERDYKGGTRGKYKRHKKVTVKAIPTKLRRVLEGKCRDCESPRCEQSKAFCEFHLLTNRKRNRRTK